MGCKPLYITSLNSGSNGNCYYVGNAEEAVLIDAGISCRETEKRMARLGLSMEKVRAVFISHEHTDHIRGLAVLARKYSLPVFITPGTYRHSKLDLPEELLHFFNGKQTISVGSLQVSCFPKIHDAAEPHSFMVSCGTVKVGVFTDLGAVCASLKHYFQQCHAVFLEANYDEALLAQGSYPYYLKRRISGGRGHLSNTQALELFKSHRPAHLSHLLLAHLSKDNNCPDLVAAMFNAHAAQTTIVVASRDMETPLFTVYGTAGSAAETAGRGYSAVQLQCF